METERETEMEAQRERDSEGNKKDRQKKMQTEREIPNEFLFTTYASFVVYNNRAVYVAALMSVRFKNNPLTLTHQCEKIPVTCTMREIQRDRQRETERERFAKLFSVYDLRKASHHFFFFVLLQEH